MYSKEFELAEKQERMYLNKLVSNYFTKINKIEYSKEGSYDRFDAYVTGSTFNEYCIEVKCREEEALMFDTAILEKSKVDALPEDRSYLLYIYVILDCAYLWQVKKEDIQKQPVIKKNMPVTTKGNSKEYRLTDCYELPYTSTIGFFNLEKLGEV